MNNWQPHSCPRYDYDNMIFVHVVFKSDWIILMVMNKKHTLKIGLKYNYAFLLFKIPGFIDQNYNKILEFSSSVWAIIGQCTHHACNWTVLNRAINTPCLCKWKEGVACACYCLTFCPFNCCFFLDEKVQRIPSQCNHLILLITWIITAWIGLLLVLLLLYTCTMYMYQSE